LELAFQGSGNYGEAGEWYYRGMCCLRQQMARDGGGKVRGALNWLAWPARSLAWTLRHRRPASAPAAGGDVAQQAEEPAVEGQQPAPRPPVAPRPGLVERLIWWLMASVAGYGERPSWLLGWMAGTLLTFAVLQGIAGIGVARSGPGPGPSTETVSGVEALMHFGTCLYFSFVTFTTLGYGDVRPCGALGQFLSCAEAVAGFVLMTLFLVCVVRKFSR
jgi:hypothetical protein